MAIWLVAVIVIFGLLDHLGQSYAAAAGKQVVIAHAAMSLRSCRPSNSITSAAA